MIDYGAGNIGSVLRAFKLLGMECLPTSDPTDFCRFTHLVLPGVGSFDYCMARLVSSGLVDALKDCVLVQRVPLLGICVGAQMLGKSSQEGVGEGLGFIEMECVRFPGTSGNKVPHVGWTKLRRLGSIDNCFLTDKILHGRAYFTHSYYMLPMLEENILFTSKHGFTFCSAVYRDNIVGVQYHPEKSQRTGLEFLRIFATEYGR